MMHRTMKTSLLITGILIIGLTSCMAPNTSDIKDAADCLRRHTFWRGVVNPDTKQTTPSKFGICSKGINKFDSVCDQAKIARKIKNIYDNKYEVIHQLIQDLGFLAGRPEIRNRKPRKQMRNRLLRSNKPSKNILRNQKNFRLKRRLVIHGKWRDEIKIKALECVYYEAQMIGDTVCKMCSYMPFKFFEKNKIPEFKISKNTCKTAIYKCGWLWSQMIRISKRVENQIMRKTGPKNNRISSKNFQENLDINQKVESLILNLKVNSITKSTTTTTTKAQMLNSGLSEEDEALICDNMLNLLDRPPKIYRRGEAQGDNQETFGAKQVDTGVENVNISHFDGQPVVKDEKWQEGYKPENINLSWIIQDEIQEARKSFENYSEVNDNFFRSRF